MSFAGNAAPAGGLLNSAVYVPPAPWTQAIYSNDDLLYKGVAGFVTDTPVEAGYRLRTIVLSIIGQPLSAYASTSVNGSAGDTGILTTADLSAGDRPTQHGLPANFGPGRDQWTPADMHRLTCDLLEQQMLAPVAGDGAVVPAGISVAGGNLTIIIKNTSPNPIDTVSLRLQYDPS